MIDAAFKAFWITGALAVGVVILKFALGKGEEAQPAPSFELVPPERLFDHHEYAVVQVRAAQRRIVEIYEDPFAALEAMYRYRRLAEYPEEWRVVNADDSSYGFLDPRPGAELPAYRETRA